MIRREATETEGLVIKSTHTEGKNWANGDNKQMIYFMWPGELRILIRIHPISDCIVINFKQRRKYIIIGV